jgi:tRNA(fMet)-specific endonuclease VapC
MTYLLDTNAFSDLMNEHPMIDAHLAAIPSTARVVVCPIVRGEIRFGIERLPQGKHRQELETKAARCSAMVPCEPMPEAVGDQYATVKVSSQRKGLVLNENDLWIAATALALGAVLVSRDTEFQKVDGLTVEDWTA